ncbi:hypothetical protein A4X13_0g8649, partial [Tilletia indica]
LSLYLVKKLIAKFTELLPKRVDMCKHSCIAFVGKYSDLTHCPWRRTEKDEKGKKKTFICGESRFDEKGKARRLYWTLPVLDRLKAMFLNPTMSQLLRYRHEHLQGLQRAKGTTGGWDDFVFQDTVDGLNNLTLAAKGVLEEPRDIALAIATDGAQLIANKDSSVWVITAACLNTPPAVRFQRAHQMVLAVIPGPNAPGDIESFFRPILQEMAQLSVGAWVWDGLTEEWFVLKAVLVGLYADQPGSSKLNKMTGTQGRRGCRLCMIEGCYGHTRSGDGGQEDGDGREPGGDQQQSSTGNSTAVPGHGIQQQANSGDGTATPGGNGTAAPRGSQKAGKTPYFPLRTPTSLLTLPSNQDRPSTYDPAALPLRTHAIYEEHIDEINACTSKAALAATAKQTGVAALPLLAYSPGFLHPEFFPLDVYHLYSFNTLALLWKAFRSQAPGDPFTLTEDESIRFGRMVADAAADLPGAFGAPARNPHKYFNTRFKMFEWIAVFHQYMGPYLHSTGASARVIEMFLALLDGISFSVQSGGCTLADIKLVNKCFKRFCLLWEELFVRGQPSLLSRCRLSIHLLLHVGGLIATTGSLRASSQAACERTIGTIKKELRGHKEPFATVANRTQLVEQFHALEMLLDDQSLRKWAPASGPTDGTEDVDIKVDEPMDLSNGIEGASVEDFTAALLSQDYDLNDGTSLHASIRYTRSGETIRVRARSGLTDKSTRRDSRVAWIKPGVIDAGADTAGFFDVVAFALRLEDESLVAVGRSFLPSVTPDAVTNHWVCGRWSSDLEVIDATRIVDVMGSMEMSESRTYLFPRKNGMAGFSEWWCRYHIEARQQAG